MKKGTKIFIAVILIILAVGLLVFFALWGMAGWKIEDIGKEIKVGKVDDWQFKQEFSEEFFGMFGASNGGTSKMGTATMTADSISSEANIGYTVGGSQNAENFRKNIENNYFPISTDITYNGMFSEYYFDTKGSTSEDTDKMFYPSYSVANSKDPVSGNLEKYISVGLNSNIKESDFSRKKLNLVLCLDISGSMSSSFNDYYYDQFVYGNETNTETKNDPDKNKSKMTIAEECLCSLIDELKPDDSLGIVLFESNSHIAKPLRKIEDTDLEAIKNHIMDVRDMGGTNFDAGYTDSTKLFDEYLNVDSDEYENRIIVLTDAMPNMGTYNKDEILDMIDVNAKKKIYTTFVGIGVDFNTEVVEKILNTKGANYYAVNSSSEFKKTVVEEFEYMVTPMVFDLDFSFDSKKYKIAGIYGTDSGDKSTGNIMHVNTLFPSSSNSDGEVKGGIILIKLIETGNTDTEPIKLTVSYKDRNGKEYTTSAKVDDKLFTENEYYQNTGIEKGIVLARYVNLMKNWIGFERSEGKRDFYITIQTGIFDVDYENEVIKMTLGENERSSTALTVSNEYKEIFTNFKTYFEAEMQKLKDKDMQKELNILNTLISK